MSLKFMGIYSLEILVCGCKIKRYHGGKQVLIGCKIHETSNNVSFVCGVCGKSFGEKNKGKKLLKDHQWEHAI